MGVDYCGPFFIKEKRHRNRNKIKVYAAIFVRMSTKAVHLEIVGDLTTAKAFSQTMPLILLALIVSLMNFMK